jgi:hypothetical protein
MDAPRPITSAARGRGGGKPKPVTPRLRTLTLLIPDDLGKELDAAYAACATIQRDRGAPVSDFQGFLVRGLLRKGLDAFHRAAREELKPMILTPEEARREGVRVRP